MGGDLPGGLPGWGGPREGSKLVPGILPELGGRRAGFPGGPRGGGFPGRRVDGRWGAFVGPRNVPGEELGGG